MALTAIVCDDAAGFRTLLTAMLEDAGIEVVGKASTWEEAERLAPGADLLVVDLWMPELDLDALARVRAAAPRAVLAIVSSLESEAAAEKVAGHDVDVVLTKSMPPQQLVARLVDLAAARAAEPGA